MLCTAAEMTTKFCSVIKIESRLNLALVLLFVDFALTGIFS